MANVWKSTIINAAAVRAVRPPPPSPKRTFISSAAVMTPVRRIQRAMKLIRNAPVRKAHIQWMLNDMKPNIIRIETCHIVPEMSKLAAAPERAKSHQGNCRLPRK